MDRELYLYITWPESQKFMDYEGFSDVAISGHDTGEYLLPKDWIESVEKGEVPILD